MPTFTKADRLLTPGDFKRVYERKCSVSNAWLIVYGWKNELGHARLGLSVSRKVGNAVARNRCKRLLREAFRLSREGLPANLDLIVIPRSARLPDLPGLHETFIALAADVVRRLARREDR